MPPETKYHAVDALQVHHKRSSIESLSGGCESGGSPAAEQADDKGQGDRKSMLESFKVSAVTIHQFKKPRRNKNLA